MRRTVSADDENETDMHEEFNSSLMPHFDSLMVGSNVNENELINDLLNTIGQPTGTSDEEIGGLQLDPFTPAFDQGLLDVVKREPVDDAEDNGDSLLNSTNSVDFVVNGMPHSHKLPTFSGNRHYNGPIRHTHVASVKSRPHAPHCPLHACGCSQRGPSHSSTRLHAAHPHGTHFALRNGELPQSTSPFRPLMRIPTSPSTLSSLVHTVPLSGILNQQASSVRNSLLSVAHPHELTPVSGASSNSSLHSSALGSLVLTLPRVNAAGSNLHATEEQHSLYDDKEAASNLQSRVIQPPARPVTLRRNGESDTSLFKRGLLASAFSTIEAHRGLLSADTPSSGVVSKASSNACLIASVITPIASSIENVSIAPIASCATSVNASLQSVADAGNDSRNSPTPTVDTESVAPTVSSRRKALDKASDEYRQRRERNNVAVRKSREKAKVRHEDTNRRVKDLTNENDQLLRKLESVLQELTLLKSLFQKLGAPIPDCVMHASFTTAISKHHALARGSAFSSAGSDQPADSSSTNITATLCDVLTQQNTTAATNAAGATEQSEVIQDIKVERVSPPVSEHNPEALTPPTITPAEASSTA